MLLNYPAFLILKYTRAQLEALKTLSFARVPRFQFAEMNITTLLDGGLGTFQ
jgi:hypothetical protein